MKNTILVASLLVALAAVVGTPVAMAQDASDPLDASSSSEQLANRLQSGHSVSADMQSTVDDLTQDQTSDMLSGDTKLACEAVVCLSSGSPPSECSASLARYFGIKLSKPWKTAQARANFLKLCPSK